MAFELRDRFETSDGSHPLSAPLADGQASGLALAAFAILRGGDVVEAGRAAVPAELASTASAYLRQRVEIGPEPVAVAVRERVERDILTQLGSNPYLAARLQLAKPIRIDVVPPGASFVSAGYPRNVANQVAGIFWDQPSWERARIGLRQEQLAEDRSLVFHEMAHAVFYLGFTSSEQKLVYALLRPSFGSRAAMDEVFAIYSEHELAGDFDADGLKAPGVYGHTRRQWHEDHAFTRFVRKLYFPHRPVAGPKMRPLRDGSWMTKLGR